MNTMSLEALLNSTVTSKVGEQNIEVVPDFRVAVQHSDSEGTHFIIHPHGYDGDTLDFVVRGNELFEVGQN